MLPIGYSHLTIILSSRHSLRPAPPVSQKYQQDIVEWGSRSSHRTMCCELPLLLYGDTSTHRDKPHEAPGTMHAEGDEKLYSEQQTAQSDHITLAHGHRAPASG